MDYNKYQDFKIIRQESTNDCGIASWKMLLEHYDILYLFENVKIPNLCENKGLNLYEMIEIGKNFNFQLYWFRLDSNVDIFHINLPTIILKNKKHFCILFGFDKKRAYFIDPLNGKFNQSIETLYDEDIIYMQYKIFQL